MLEPSRVDTILKNKESVSGLGILQVFIGLGAVGGGLALVLEPSGANLGITDHANERSGSFKLGGV